MKKQIILIFLILSNYIFSFEIVGQVYNLQKRGSSYNGTLDVRGVESRKNYRIKLIPSKEVEIVGVDGYKNENNIYEISNKNLRIDFIYKDEIAYEEKKIFIGRIDYLDDFKKTENLIGDIVVEFRKQGILNMNTRGEINFGVIPSQIPKGGLKSKSDAEIDIRLEIDRRDVGNTKMYFQYPKEVVMANGQLLVIINAENKGDFILDSVENGKDTKKIGFIPREENISKKIKLEGRIFSKVPNVSPGDYKEKIVLKAYYEYLDYSIEKKSMDKKRIIRR